LASDHGAYAVVLSRNGGHAYVAYASLTVSQPGSVLILDTDAMAVLASVPVGNFPDAINTSQDGETVYVANGSSAAVSDRLLFR
jgi:DNA-binding beta-propeller fold protein YncE